MKRPKLDVSSLLRSNPYIKLIDQYIKMLESKIVDQSKKIKELEKKLQKDALSPWHGHGQYGIIAIVRLRDRKFKF